MNREYGRQFQKLLRVVHDEYVPRLASAADAAESGHLSVRLKTYLQSRAWETEPEGRNMPETDESGTLRAGSQNYNAGGGGYNGRGGDGGGGGRGGYNSYGGRRY